ncbi:MAG: glutathionylspermidine synthase family protein [Halothermotrichaceae bacterium]
MTSINKYQEKFLKPIKKSPDKYYKDYLMAKKKVDNSSAIYKGEVVDFLYQALFFNKKEYKKLKGYNQTLSKILDKVIEEYKEKPSFRKYFNFPKLMEELILIDPGYNQNFPIARFDIFYKQNGSSKFCELNADGSSAMNEVRVLQKVMEETKAFKKFTVNKETAGFELFYSWIDEIINNYNQFTGGEEDKPNIAIVDFEGEGTIYEFKEFKKRFIEKGYKTIICDPRNLEYNDGSLYHNQFRVDLIYRRATTARLVEEADSIQDFLEAYKNKDVCVVGGLLSELIHNKIIFAVLHNEKAVSFLNNDEKQFIKEHIPFTKIIDFDNMEMVQEIMDNKNKYILKPFDKYAGYGVHVGRDYNHLAWVTILKEITGQDYIVQEFIDVPQLKMAGIEKGTISIQDYGFLLGMFLYNQQTKGLYTRVGRENIIGSIVESFTVPNFIITEEC